MQDQGDRCVPGRLVVVTGFDTAAWAVDDQFRHLRVSFPELSAYGATAL
jgi:hypothetical protein